jgi:hypothetical protein
MIENLLKNSRKFHNTKLKIDKNLIKSETEENRWNLIENSIFADNIMDFFQPIRFHKKFTGNWNNKNNK